MLIIGCDFHPGFQQVAIFDNQTGEYQEKRLSHREEAELLPDPPQLLPPARGMLAGNQPKVAAHLTPILEALRAS